MGMLICYRDRDTGNNAQKPADTPIPEKVEETIEVEEKEPVKANKSVTTAKKKTTTRKTATKKK